MRSVSICTVYVAVMVPNRLTYDSLDRWNVIPACRRVFEALCELVFLGRHLVSVPYVQEPGSHGVVDFAAIFPLDHFVTSFSSSCRGDFVSIDASKLQTCVLPERNNATERIVRG
jgi:hypothetical protein